MHPVLTRRALTLAYAAVWLAIGAALGSLGGLPPLLTIVFAVPMAMLVGFICLGAWYVCRMMPLRADTALRVVPMFTLAALVSGSLWIGFGHAWVALLNGWGWAPEAAATFARLRPLLFPLAVLLFLFSGAVHYLFVAVDASRVAETRALRMQVLAAQAELRALRAQITPHFLFNSLNSISALTSTDPAGARRMCVLLGDFLRGTLKVGSLEHIPLEDELALVDQFLTIEQVRFGPRLRVERDVHASAQACLVPPLILQPLAENAVRHGLSQLVDGGTLHIHGRLVAGDLVLAISNPVDIDARPRRGDGGLGLRNVRKRLEAAYGASVIMVAGRVEDQFRVELKLPGRFPIDDTRAAVVDVARADRG